VGSIVIEPALPRIANGEDITARSARTQRKTDQSRAYNFLKTVSLNDYT
jgi:hypothetical protein